MSALVLRRVFKAFHYRDFRLQWMGACTSSIGTWMQRMAQSWLVLEISKSPSMLGLDAFLGELPIVLFSLYGGVIADRVDRRRLLILSQLLQLTCAFTLATLVGLGLVKIWHILTLSFFVGTAQAFGGPAYSALVPSLVDPEDLPNAIALNSIQFNLARVIGPVLAQAVYSRLGYAWCFGLNGISYVAVIITLFSLHTRYIPAKTEISPIASMKQGFGFIRDQGAMVSLILIAFCMTALGVPLLTFLPVIAKEIFHGGTEVFSRMLAVSGAGSVAGALIVASLGHIKNKGRVALIMLILLGSGIVAFSLSRSLWSSYALLFVSGAALMGAFAMIASLVQLITANDMRGRVMSVYNVAFRGGMPFGNLICGRAVEMFSAPPVLAVNGLLLGALGTYYLVVRRKVAAL